MKKKSIIAAIALLVCLSFGQAASAAYSMDPGGGGGGTKPPCTSTGQCLEP